MIKFMTKKKLHRLLDETWLDGQAYGYKVGEQDGIIMVVKDAPLPDGFLNGKTGQYYTGVGQRVGHTHPVNDSCAERGCVIHSPSEHGMRDMPTLWRGDRYLMERLCPHGVGHPDPDDMSFKKTVMSEEDWVAEGVHGCDGCCSNSDHRRAATVEDIAEEFEKHAS